MTREVQTHVAQGSTVYIICYHLCKKKAQSIHFYFLYVHKIALGRENTKNDNIVWSFIFFIVLSLCEVTSQIDFFTCLFSVSSPGIRVP